MNRILIAAAVIAELPTTLGAQLTRDLSSEQASSLAAAMAEYSALSPHKVRAALLMFAFEMQSRGSRKPSSLDRRGLAGLCRHSPDLAASLLCEWVQAATQDHAIGPLQSRPLNRHWTSSELEPCSLAGLILMSFAPEFSAEVFKNLAPIQVQKITIAISKLPMIEADVRKGILDELARHLSIAPENLELMSPLLLTDFINRLVTLQIDPPAAETVLPGGLCLVYGPELSIFMSHLPHDIKNLYEELSAAWARPVVPVKFVASGGPGLEVVLYHDRVEISRAVASGCDAEAQQIIAKLLIARWAELARDVQPSQSGVQGKDLSLSFTSNGLAAMAAIRNFPSPMLTHELHSLRAQDLVRVAAGLVEFLAMPLDEFNKCLRESVNFAPSELLHSAGLRGRSKNSWWESCSAVSIILSLVPNGADLLHDLLPQLTRERAVKLTDKLFRLIYRRELSQLSQRDRYLAVGQVAEWRMAQRSAPRAPGLEGTGFIADPLLLAKKVAAIWPHLTTAQSLLDLTTFSSQKPDQMVKLLVSYLEGSSPGWVAGPLRAAQFLNSLNDPEPVRQQLLAWGYPIPRLAVDLELMQRARREWFEADNSVPLN